MNQLPSTHLSSDNQDVDIKHYTQCSSYRYEDEPSRPYTKTPVMEFKSSSSFGSNPDQSPTSQMSTSSSMLNRHRKLGRQYSRPEVEKEADQDGGDADDGTETGKRGQTISPKVCWTSAGEEQRYTDRALQNNDKDWLTKHSIQCSERSQDSEDSNETCRRVLAATAFVWLPLCRPTARTTSDTRAIFKSDIYYEEAHRCIRLKNRRNALADPRQMAMKQEMRERIQKEVEHRKASMARKVSQYFKAIVSDDYEVDLV